MQIRCHPLEEKPSSGAKRPLLLGLWGLLLLLVGGLEMGRSFESLFKLLSSDSALDPTLGARQILLSGVLGVLAISVGYGILRERAWSRPALLVSGFLVPVLSLWLGADEESLDGLVQSMRDPEALEFTVYSGLSLYVGSRNADYYEYLLERDREPDDPAAPLEPRAVAKLASKPIANNR